MRKLLAGLVGCIAAVAILSLVGVPQRSYGANLDALISSLKTDKSFKVRANAARLLGKSGDSRASAPLQEALKDEHPVVRSTACLALASLDDPRAIIEIEKLSSDSDDAVKKACKSALK